MAELLVPNGKVQDWTEVYREIKQDHDEAYSCIEKAIKLDEEGKFNEALPIYEFGLSLIDKALGISIQCPTKPDINWEKTYVMIQKMRKTRKEIQIRIDEVQSKPHPDAIEPPPSYEEAIAAEPRPTAGPSGRDVQIPGPSRQTQPYVPPSAVYDALLDQPQNPGQQIPSYADLNNQLGDLKLQTTEPEKEIIYSHDNVRLYFIAPDGRVSAASEPNTLIIGKIKDPTLKILDDALLSIVHELRKENNEKHKKHRHHRRHVLHRRRHRHHRGKGHDEKGSIVYRNC